MKTNHQRNFKDTRDPRAVYNSYTVGGSHQFLELSDRFVAASATCGDHTNGKRGIAKDLRGAKKYVNSRTRFHENGALKKIVNELSLGDDLSEDI